MIKFSSNLLFLLVVASLLGACGYQPIKLNYADIALKREIDVTIESIIVGPAAKDTGGLIKSIKNTKPSDDDNRIYQVKAHTIYPTYPKWNAILESAISESGIFNSKSNNKLALRVTALEIKYPGWGGNYPTDITARYELIDTSSSKIIFSTTIKSHAQSEPFAYLGGHHRWMEAMNRTINKNVKLFIEELLKSNTFKSYSS